MENKQLITIEHVGAGHPDKVADSISDYIANWLRSVGANKTAIETMIGHGKINISGEIERGLKLDYISLVDERRLPTNAFKEMLKKYDEGYENFKVYFNLVEQSEEINKQVDKKDSKIGAGDQGIMVGVASNFTKSKLPLEKDLILRLDNTIQNYLIINKSEVYKQDYKIQLTTKLGYGSTEPERIHLAIQLHEGCEDYELYTEEIKDYLSSANLMDYDKIFSVVFFHRGGANADVGVTGRKLVCDAYGPRFPIGGGATAGKDLSKVDRSGKLYARWLAVEMLNFVEGAEKLSQDPSYDRIEIEVQIAYIIGEELPLHITFKENGKPANKMYEKRYGEMFITWLKSHSLSLEEVIYKINNGDIKDDINSY